MQGSGNNLSRGSGALLSSDMPLLPNCLPLEPITLGGNQKLIRSGELRRALGVPHGSTQEDHSFGVPRPKPPSEELKHFKDSVQESTRKARDRAKKLRESIVKLDKYEEVLNSKKRQRNDISPSERVGGVNLVKTGSQVHRNASDVLTQRSEDRAKIAGLNKRVRSSVADVRVDNRPGANARQLMGIEKDGDAFPSINGSAVRGEEKIRRLPAGGEGWDMKMKKKRSAGIVGNRIANADRDMKRAMQQKINAESKLRGGDAQGYRSKSSPGLGGINKLDGSFDSAGSDVSTPIRNELDSPSFSRDRVGTLEQRVMAKGGNKASFQDDSPANSPNRMLKGKVRTPRTGPIMVLDSSSKVQPPSGALQSWEQPASVNKISVLGFGNKKKNAMPMDSSSHAMAQWVGQRPNKNSRSKRANLVPPVSIHAEAQSSPQGLATPDFSPRTSFGVGGSVLASGVDNATLKVKREMENVSSPFGPSESEESGAGGNKLKDRSRESGEVDLPMAGTFTLPTRKNKISSYEIDDGVRRQGRPGSSPSFTRPIHPMREKSGNVPGTKPIHSARSSSDKNKSKSGRPPSKKMKDRKTSARVGSVLNAISLEFPESDDDRDELFTAASSARNANSLACSGPFWKKMELIFASANPENASYLKQQVSLAEELDESLSQIFEDDYNVLGVIKQKETPHCSVEESAEANVSSGRLDVKKVDKATPLYQRVLSALIEEDENEEFCQHFEGKNLSLHYASDDSHCGSCNQLDIEPKDRDRMESEVESNADFQSQKSSLLDGLSCNISIASNPFRNPSMSNSLHSSEQWLGDDGFSHSDMGPIGEICSHDLAHPQPRETNISSVPSSERKYQFMSMEDKLMLELQSIGIYPEILPDLAEGEKAINQNVLELNENLYQQVQRKKRKLGKIDKAITKGRDSEKRNVERVAMDQLIHIAYRKRVACRNTSKNAVRKVPKQVALAFIKRTLVRCRKFEEAGISCFSDPVIQDVMFSAPPCSNDAKSVDCVGSGTASNTLNETSNQHIEARASGAVSSTFERYGSPDAPPSVHSSEQGVSRHGIMLKRKREVLIDDVVGSASSRITSSLDGHHVNIGIRGKRSDRDQARDNSKNSSLTGAQERKNKTKPKQKNNNLHPPRGSSKQQSAANASNIPRHQSKEADDPLDFSKLNDLDVAEELGGGNPDLGTWLNFDEDALQDIDTMGLEIPMDDLTDLKFAF